MSIVRLQSHQQPLFPVHKEARKSFIGRTDGTVFKNVAHRWKKHFTVHIPSRTRFQHRKSIPGRKTKTNNKQWRAGEGFRGRSSPSPRFRRNNRIGKPNSNVEHGRSKKKKKNPHSRHFNFFKTFPASVRAVKHDYVFSPLIGGGGGGGVARLLAAHNWVVYFLSYFFFFNTVTSARRSSRWWRSSRWRRRGTRRENTHAHPTPPDRILA